MLFEREKESNYNSILSCIRTSLNTESRFCTNASIRHVISLHSLESQMLVGLQFNYKLWKCCTVFFCCRDPSVPIGFGNGVLHNSNTTIIVVCHLFSGVPLFFVIQCFNTSFSMMQIKRKSRASPVKHQGLYLVTLLS